MVLTSKDTPEEIRGKARLMEDIADKEEEIDSIEEDIKRWVNSRPIQDEYSLFIDVSKEYEMNLSEVKKVFGAFPKQYKIENETIPTLIKSLRKARRKLKGEQKVNFTKSIENLIFAYSNHLDDCIKSIYWLTPYQYPLKHMSPKEDSLKKLHSVQDKDSRAKIIDCLCKYWESQLDRNTIGYGTEFSKLEKDMKGARRQFSKIVKEIPNQRVKKKPQQRLQEEIIKAVSNEQGIPFRSLKENLPPSLQRRITSQILLKAIDKAGCTNINGALYRLPEDIKKDLYAYTAAFIDSDGYITMDRNLNPRVGLVATGDRGRAFMTEMQKSLGLGRLLVDQVSPQNTRPVHRLQFYSQSEIGELLKKCRPHFRMKGGNADILLELIRIKKSHKKRDWAKDRMKELFKLMKWYNHRDNTRFDFAKEGIDPENISKYEGNNKMNIMDDLENIAKEVHT